MKLTVFICLLIFVTIVTGQIEDFDLDLYKACMKDNPRILNDLITVLSNDFKIIVNDDNFYKLFECQLRAYHMVKSDNTLDFEKLKPLFHQLLTYGKYFIFPADFDQQYTTCTVAPVAKLNVGLTFVELYNCIIEENAYVFVTKSTYSNKNV